MLCCAVLCCAVLCCAVLCAALHCEPRCVAMCCAMLCRAVLRCVVLRCAVLCAPLSVLHIAMQCFSCQCRQRVTVIPYLISHCNSCLQALLPAQTSSLPVHPALSSEHLAKPRAPCDSSSNSPNAQAASAKAAVSLSDLASDGVPDDVCTGSGNLEPRETVADVQAFVNGPLSEGTVLEGAVVEGQVLEGPVGQALAEATIEMVLAALKNSEDSGQHSIAIFLYTLSRL